MHSGPLDARIMIVGEAPGMDEERLGQPFVGVSGRALNDMLAQAGISRDACFITNVCHIRPPNNEIESFFYTKTEAKLLSRTPTLDRYPNDHILSGMGELWDYIRRVDPVVVLALGDTSLWALTGLESISKWRGSILESLNTNTKVIPTHHPASVLRQEVQRPIAIQDMRRARRESEFREIRKPAYDFKVGLGYDATIELLLWIRERPDLVIAADIETNKNQIDCIGLAWSKTEGVCIPFQQYPNRSYWTPHQEVFVLDILKSILQTNPIIFHNGIFDCQYIAKQWGFLPNIQHDTMVMQHVCFPGLMGGKIDSTTGRVSKKGSSLSLSFIASMYCEYYKFWKDDGRLFDPSKDDERQLWRYNVEDCVRTYECYEVLGNALTSLKLQDPYRFEMSLFTPILRMMFRGIRIDTSKRWKFRNDIALEMTRLQKWVDEALGLPFNMQSPPQAKQVFYDGFGIPPILHRKTKKPTLDDDALEVIKKRNPLLRPIIKRIQRFRSLGVLKSTFVEAPLSSDNRLRTCINITGAETFRFSSNETAFKEGTNLQNVPKLVEEMK